MVQFEVGKHYDGAVCLARRGKKETWVYMPPHKEGQPMPEYWPRGKSGLYCDWYKVRVANGIECAGPAWMRFRADNYETDREPTRAALKKIINGDGQSSVKQKKRKSRKQIEREEYEESCRMAREFYAGIFRRIFNGVSFLIRKYQSLFKWMFSHSGYSRKR